MMNENLNRVFSYNNSTNSGAVTCFFRNLKEELIDRIEKSDMVIGAVAWITDIDILAALSKKPCLLVIQKEDFLRPDMCSRLSKKEKTRLHDAYTKLKSFDGTNVNVGPFYQDTENLYKDIPPILCFGYHNEGEMYRTPRLHNKFLVFLKLSNGIFSPKAVWTGSLNLTRLSMHSLENAVVIDDEKIAEAFAEEAVMIYLEGEPLDWKSSWINPFFKAKQSRRYYEVYLQHGRSSEKDSNS